MNLYIKIITFLLFTSSLAFSQTGPDLVIESVEVLSCESNGSISYAATIKNVGDVVSLLDNNQSTCSQMVSIQAYLRVNNNGTTNGNDKPAGGTVISCSPDDLQPGESIVKTFSATVSSGIDPSVTPYLEIYLISERITNFSDVNIDSNNSGFSALPNKIGPDLIMESVEVLACDADGSISYAATIKNVGDEVALLDNNQSTCSQMVSIQAYLRVNNDGITSGNDKPAGGTVISCSPGDLQPGESIVKTFSATVSSGIDPSVTPYLEIYLIPQRITDFSDVNIDANNSGFTALGDKIGPDLIMESVEVLSCDADGSISYAATIKNVGDEVALLDNNQSTCSQMVSIQAYLRVNNDGTTTGNDKPAGGTVISCSPSDLQPGESVVKTFSAGIAGGIDPGITPYLEIYIIPERLTSFSDVNIDANNSGFTALGDKIGPDLIMESVEVLSCDEEGSISYAATIKNVGDEVALLDNNQSTCSQMVSIQAYLRVNNDGTTSGDDKPAGGTVISCSPSDLQPGESVVKTFSAGVAGGIDPSITPYLEIYIIPERLTPFSDANIDADNSGFTSLPAKAEDCNQLHEVEGAIKIGDTSCATDGSIRFTGQDFEGYMNGQWYSLTQGYFPFGLASRNGSDGVQLDKDLEPIAIGVISVDGTKSGGSENITSVWNALNSEYEITIVGEKYDFTGFTTRVNPIKGNFTASTNSVDGKLLISLYDSNGKPTQGNFSFETTKI